MVRRLFSLLIVFCISGCSLSAQTKKCECEVFLSTEFSGEEKVFTTKNEYYQIAHDIPNEDFIHFSLLAQNDNLLKVVPHGILKDYDTGWVDNKHVAVYGTNYNSSLFIYQQPDFESKRVAEVKKYFEPEYHVVGCNGKWLRVRFTMNDKQVEGWLAPYDQCWSAYTTCN